MAEERIPHTLMTFRRPSKTSRSLRLSSNFFICANGKSRCEGRELTVLAEPADCAASNVNSRADANISPAGNIGGWERARTCI